AVADLRANLLNSGLLASLIALVEDIGSTLIGIFSIGFMAFFFLKEPGTLGRIFITLVPSVFDQRMEEALVKLKTQLRRYFLGLLGQTAIFTTLLTSSLYLLGFRDALLIGLIGGILNLIPYLGPMIGGAFGVLLFVAGNITMPFPFLQEGILILIAVFLGCQAVDNLFVSTLIFSNTLKTHPLEIFVVSLVAGILGGVVGMVIAIPCYTAVRVFLKEFMPENRFVKALSS
ncbi:MAG: AI-2E family transporter, partial [Sphingobacteriia bacterium]